MTESEFRSFLLFASVLFLVLGVVNLMRPGKRWLGVGGVVLFLAAQMFAKEVSRLALYGTLALGLFCIAMDVASRSKRKVA